MSKQNANGALGALPVVASSEAPILVEDDGAYAGLIFETTELAGLTQTHIDQSNASSFRIYLVLDDVKGTFDATVLRVNLQQSNQLPEIYLGSVALFGLRQASLNESGKGMQFYLDITPHAVQLLSDSTLIQRQVTISIRPTKALPAGVVITVGQLRLCLEKFGDDRTD